MESFAIVPTTSRGLWIFVGVVLFILIAAGMLLIATARGARSSRFELSEDGLRLRGDLYGRLIPATDLRGSAARLVDLSRSLELQPRRRTAGTAFPGYRAGWFYLRTGEKALLYLTDTHHAVYIPTRRGYSVLLSPQQPERFLDRLRSIAPGD
jgi:hypothetical protein